MTDRDPTSSTPGDVVHTTVKFALGALTGDPLTVASSLFELVRAPLERRKDTWMRDVDSRLAELEAKKPGLIDDAVRDERFITLLYRAAGAAIRTHESAKREALRNAVLNAAVGTAPDEDLQHMFLSFVDYLTATHLRLLELLSGPKQYFSLHGLHWSSQWNNCMTNYDDLISKGIPQLLKRKAIADVMWADLDRRGLVVTRSIITKRFEDDHLTDLGHLFLAFITEPQ